MILSSANSRIDLHNDNNPQKLHILGMKKMFLLKIFGVYHVVKRDDVLALKVCHAYRSLPLVPYGLKYKLI